MQLPLEPQRAAAIGADGRTVRLADGAEVVSFATGSYLGLDRDPRLAEGAMAAIARCGVSFSAPRTVMTSPVLAEAEDLLSLVFGRPAVIAASRTQAHAAALPVLLGADDVVLYDQRVHPSVQSALAAVPAHPPIEAVAHHDLERLEAAVERAVLGGARRVWFCADGIDRLGDRLPVGPLGPLMRRHPALWVYVDDALGTSWCGLRGSGSVLDAGLPPERTIVTTSLGKGFGVAGGAILVPDSELARRIATLGPSFSSGAALAPPLLGAVCASARIHLGRELGGLQAELAGSLHRVREHLAAEEGLAARLAGSGAPTPVHHLVLGDGFRVEAAARRLVERGLLVTPLAYPAVPRAWAGLRFAVTRAHTDADLRSLVGELGAVVRDLPEEDEARPRRIRRRFAECPRGV